MIPRECTVLPTDAPLCFASGEQNAPPYISIIRTIEITTTRINKSKQSKIFPCRYPLKAHAKDMDTMKVEPEYFYVFEIPFTFLPAGSKIWDILSFEFSRKDRG